MRKLRDGDPLTPEGGEFVEDEIGGSDISMPEIDSDNPENN